MQALVVGNNDIGVDAELFSGSRDSGIKRWDLRNGELKQSLNNAHKGWISGMAIHGDVLLSSCRGGVIRYVFHRFYLEFRLTNSFLTNKKIVER